MIKIFRYELRRRVLSKFFLGLMAVCALFSWLILRGNTIKGIANTAPFSSWSFGHYIGSVMPLLIVVLLFSLWGMLSPGAKSVEMLTDASPVPKGGYFLIKCWAVVLSWLIMLTLVVILGIAFLKILFHDAVDVGTLISPSIMAAIPAMLLAFGLGLLAGRQKPWLAFLIMGLMLIISFLPVPDFLEPFCLHFYSSYPLEAGILDPDFYVPSSIILGRLLLTAVGIGAIALAVPKNKNPKATL